MKISTRFIDDKGFIYFWTGRNKLLVLKYIKMLAKKTNSTEGEIFRAIIDKYISN